ncbi:hypothetical protein QUR91_01680 [Pseudomonas asiatica]|nr:hypothetical protein [Pseudomonas asiatica]WJN50559.1 hypothetical protein QUR91_01680 [Pseudomonas asiatica]
MPLCLAPGIHIGFDIQPKPDDTGGEQQHTDRLADESKGAQHDNRQVQLVTPVLATQVAVADQQTKAGLQVFPDPVPHLGKQRLADWHALAKGPARCTRHTAARAHRLQPGLALGRVGVSVRFVQRVIPGLGIIRQQALGHPGMQGVLSLELAQRGRGSRGVQQHTSLLALEGQQVPGPFHLIGLYIEPTTATRLGQRKQAHPPPRFKPHPAPQPSTIIDLDQAITQADFDVGDKADLDQQRQVQALLAPEVVIFCAHLRCEVERPEVIHDLARVKLHLVVRTVLTGVVALIVEATVGPGSFLVLEVLAETLDPQIGETHGMHGGIAVRPTAEGGGRTLVTGIEAVPPDLIGVQRRAGVLQQVVACLPVGHGLQVREGCPVMPCLFHHDTRIGEPRQAACKRVVLNHLHKAPR